MEKIMITKTSGEAELFSEAKLRRSLERVNASPEIIGQIVSHIRKELKPRISTSQIYRHAFSLLRKRESPSIAARYALKQAIRELGPNGHPFEKLVGGLLLAEGFTVEVGKIVQGLCVNHELDVIAQKDNQHIMVECKFHNQPEMKSDVKVALYIQARFEDVEKAWKRNKEHAQKFHEAWLITNTRLTSDAIRYAKCIGVKAIGWNYPTDDSLEIRIDRSGVHPITCLTTLTNSQKRQFLEKGVVLCRDVLNNQDILRSFGIVNTKAAKIVSEIQGLCKEQKHF